MSKKEWTLFQKYDDIRQRTGHAPICQAASYERTYKRADDAMEFIMSTPGMKRDGCDIVQSGWITETSFRDNPLALWRHSDRERTDILGNWRKVWKSSAGGAPLHLRGVLTWASPDENEDIRYYRNLYENRVLRAMSVRWEDDGPDSIREITPEELEGENVDAWAHLFGGIRFLRAVLIEGSLCPLGMDKQALSVRCRDGSIPEAVLGRLVANAAIPRVPEGREVLLLDGHPVRFDVERPEIVDLGRQPTTAAPFQGVLVSYPTDPAGQMRFAQRHMRTVAANGIVDEDERQELTKCFTDRQASPPWETKSGRAYEVLHKTLDVADSPEVVESLRRAIETVGRQCFGEARLREAWEPREFPEGPESVWASVRALLDEGLVPVVADEVERDAHVDTLLTGLDCLVGDTIRVGGGLRNALADIADSLELSPGATPEQIVETCRNLIAGAGQVPPPETRAVTEPEPVHTADNDLLALAEWVKERSAKQTKAVVPTRTHAKTLIDRVSSDL